MQSVKPRFLPRDLGDAALSFGAFVIQFAALFMLPSLAIAMLVSLRSGLLCFLAIYVVFVLFTVKEIRVSDEGLQFVRLAGYPKRLAWGEISGITKATSGELIVRGWLWPLLPAREMTPSLTTRGHYKISFDGGCVYYPPRDAQQFEALLPAHLRSNKTMQPTREDARA
jgi:hypothetical protein